MKTYAPYTIFLVFCQVFLAKNDYDKIKGCTITDNDIIEINKKVNVDEILLTIDSMTGQDAVNVAKTFDEKLAITGVVLTKLDGTAKGGFVISLIDEYQIPVAFVGVGEKIDDLQADLSKYLNFII